MCVYVGKSIDIFEDVWNLWMGCLNVSQYIHADVLSFRCFAFYCGEDVKRWFSPIQTIDKALMELCVNLGIEKMCSIIPVCDWYKQIVELNYPVLLADTCFDVREASALREYYKGIGSYLVLFRHENKKQMICAASGIPYVEISEEQIKEELSKSDGFVVARTMPLQMQIAPAGEILHKGMQWRRSAVCNENYFGQLCLECDKKIPDKKIPDRKLQLAVQYGLMNYQIQLSKVVRFCKQELKASKFIVEELNGILLKIPQVNRIYPYKEIVQIDKKFWALIEKIEENCYV